LNDIYIHCILNHVKSRANDRCLSTFGNELQQYAYAAYSEWTDIARTNPPLAATTVSEVTFKQGSYPHCLAVVSSAFGETI